MIRVLGTPVMTFSIIIIIIIITSTPPSPPPPQGHNGSSLSYTNSKVMKIIKGAAIVCGDVNDGGSSSGGRSGGSSSGNHSALGQQFFEDEGYYIPHSAPGE